MSPSTFAVAAESNSNCSPTSVTSMMRTRNICVTSCEIALPIRPLTRNDTASDPTSRRRRSATDAGGGPGLNIGMRRVMPSLRGSAPVCCASRNGADKVGKSVSREAITPCRLFGCALISSPARAALPDSGCTQVVR